MKPALISEKKDSQPILIVDKKGVLGAKIAEILSTEAIIIFVSELHLDLDNVVSLNFGKKTPVIPDARYSHIFVFNDSAPLIKEALRAFIEKARETQGKLVFVSEIHELTAKDVKEVEEYKNGKIAIYGDIFSYDKGFNNPASQILEEASRKGRVVLPNDGLSEVYPIEFSDLSRGIVEVMFGPDEKTKHFFLFANPMTLLSFSFRIQRIFPALKIDFKNDETKRNINYNIKEGKFLFTDYDLNSRIKNFSFKELKKNVIERNISREKGKHKISFWRLWIGGWIAAFLILPLLFSLCFGILGYSQLLQTKENLAKGKISQAKNSNVMAVFFLKSLEKNLNLLSLQLGIIRQNEILRNIKTETRNGLVVAEAAEGLISLSENLKMQIGEENKKTSAREARFALEKFVINSQKLAAEGDKTLTEYSEILSVSSAIAPYLDLIFGAQKEKKYLVLFQNNMELWPSGGFIGSYGLLTVKDGQIKDFKIQDVYENDGQLKVHIEPPYAVRRHVKNVHMFVRNSNFNIDFAKAANDVASMYRLETKEQVNGIIAIDLDFVKRILENSDPLEVTDYNLKIDASNFFLATESQVEKNFFPGSTQKKQFLKSLFSSLMQKIQSGKIKSEVLVKAFVDSLKTKDVLFAFDDISLQQLSSANNWSSSIENTVTRGVSDFFGINEANVGSNKVNYFISRSLAQKIIIDEKGQVTEEATISYRNNSDGSWPGGEYVNYLRLIIPKDSVLSGIEINGIEQKLIDAETNFLIYENKKHVFPNGLEVETYEQSGKTIYGFLLKVPKKGLTVVKVKYELNQKVDLLASSGYSFKMFKQPGSGEYPYSLSIFLPEGFQFTDASSQISFNDNRGIFAESVSTDLDLNFKIGKK